MEEPPKSLGQPCEICGDIGHAPAILICSNCHTTREHIYCMNPNLLNYPASWHCEACRRQKVDHDCNKRNGVVHNSCAKKAPLTSYKRTDGMVHSSCAKKVTLTSRIRSSRKVQFLPVEDIYTLEAGTKRKPSDTQCFSRSRMGFFDTDRNHVPKRTSETPISNYTAPALDVVQGKCGCQNTLPEFDKHADEVDSFLCKENHDVIERCEDDETPQEKTSYIFGEEDIPNPPAVNPSWKGSCEILNFPHELYDGLEAYLPGSVSYMAYLVSQKMPKVLQFTLHPRLDVWPESFHIDSPSELDICLYFWADGFCRKKYDGLLELMVKEDLSLQCILSGAELRIFTSRQLPLESQRINQQYYLWGVFLSSKGDHYSVNSRAIKQVDNDSASVANKADDQVTKGFSRDSSDMNSQEQGQKRIIGRALKQVETEYHSTIAPPELPRIHSQQRVESSCGSRKLHEVKKECSNDFDVPPGFARLIACERPIATLTMNMSPVEPLQKTTIRRPLQPVEKGFCDGIDVPPGFSRIEEKCGTRNLHQAEKEDSDSPPGFSRRVISDTARNGSVAASPKNISPMHQVQKHEPRQLQQGERECYAPALSGVDVHQPVQESCGQHDFDAPPGFSRPNIGTTADQGPIATPKMTGRMSTIASPRILSPMEQLQKPMPRQLQQVKRECYVPASLGDFDAPPGFSRPVTVAGQWPIPTAPMNMSDPERGQNSIIARQSQQAKKVYYNGIDAPPELPRASRQLHQVIRENSDASPGFSKSVTSDVSPKVEAPPGFSESVKVCDSSSKASPRDPSTSPVRKLRRVSFSSSPQVIPNRGSNAIKQKSDYFCRICRVPCPGMASLLQHCAGRKHATHVQVIKSKADGLRRELDVFLSKSTTYIAHYPVRKS